VGVIWGEGMADHCSSTRGVDFRNWIERFIRDIWHRLFAREGRA